MGQPFRIRRRVEFRDTDAAGIVHFSQYFLYMEQAEHELLRQAGTSVMLEDERGSLSWPRVSVKCDFRGAAVFEDLLDIEVGITRLGSKSVTYQFRFFRDERETAVGEVTAVFCRVFPQAPPQSLPIPADLRKLLEPFVIPPALPPAGSP